MSSQLEITTEIAERIVIDYANLSGRESANRAGFREKTIKHLESLFDKAHSLGKQEALTELEERLPEKIKYNVIYYELDSFNKIASEEYNHGFDDSIFEAKRIIKYMKKEIK